MAKNRGALAVITELNRQLGRIEKAAPGTVLKMGLFIQAEAQLRTPVDKGLLKASAVTTQGEINGNPVAAVAYTQSYAPFVHEILTNKHPVGEAKFLERAVDQNATELLAIAREGMKLE